MTEINLYGSIISVPESCVPVDLKGKVLNDDTYPSIKTIGHTGIMYICRVWDNNKLIYTGSFLAEYDIVLPSGSRMYIYVATQNYKENDNLICYVFDKNKNYYGCFIMDGDGGMEPGKDFLYNRGGLSEPDKNYLINELLDKLECDKYTAIEKKK